jgi:HEAT repeat protein
MTRTLWIVALFLLAGAAGTVSAAETVPLGDLTGPWLNLLRSENPALRTAAGAALADIVRKHPNVAGDLVNGMAAEQDAGVAAEHERRLVPLAKESPATVSALIRLLREVNTNYPARNFGVKVLSQVGPVAATPEFVEALAETHCPVPGAFLRVMRALGKDATPILTAGFRHPNETIRKRATIALRVMGRTDPAIQNLWNGLQAEPPLLQKLREGNPEDRFLAIAPLTELARTVPGTATALVSALKDQTDRGVLVEAEYRLAMLGSQSPELVAALVAGLRSEDDYTLRRLAVKVLPTVGAANLNCKEMVEALGDHNCPVPGAMRRVLLAAGKNSLPVLQVALKHSNPDIRSAAENILKRMPPAVTVTGSTAQP